MTRLADVIRPVTGRAGSQTDLPIYSVTKHHGFMLQSEYFKKKIASADTSAYKIVRANQFAYATIHLDEGAIGAAPEDCIVSPMYTVFSVDDSKVEVRYLQHLLRSPSAIVHYQHLGQGSAERRKSISLKSFGGLRIPSIDLGEQRRIASILDEADTIRTKRRAQLSHLDELPGPLFQEMNDPHSEWIAFANILEETKYGTSEKSGGSGFPTLRIPNVVTGDLDFDDIKHVSVPDKEFAKLKLMSGDLLFVRSNGNLANVGRCAVFKPALAVAAGMDPEKMIYASYLIRARLSHGIPEYVSTFMSSKDGRRQLEDLSRTSAGQYNLNSKSLQSIQMPWVSIEEQRTFAEKVTAIRTERDRVAKALEADEELFAALQHRAFRGEL